ncbi:MAG: SDR family oxidoreductase [Gemmatimonadaceae bacterium]
MILIAGGTSTLGRVVASRLLAQGAAVRILTREPGRADALAKLGAEVVRGDLRDVASLHRAAVGARTIVAAAHGFGAADVSPETVDRQGNINLVDAAKTAGADVVLMSIVGATASHPIGLFRAKHDAEEYLRGSGVGWTVVRSTAFVETWAGIMGQPLRESGRTIVFGRGHNLINFVSITDVAALMEQVVLDASLRGETIELGGTANVTFSEFATMLERVVGCTGPARHIPRVVLRAMATILPVVKPSFARQVRAAVVMDTIDMTFDSSPTRRRFPQVPNTDIASALVSVHALHPTRQAVD